MKITTTKTTSEKIEVEIDLPHYLKYGNSIFFKVISETTAIHVNDSKSNPEITVMSMSVAFNLDCEPSNAEEFNMAFDTALFDIKALQNES